jgi:hypothetical protein
VFSRLSPWIGESTIAPLHVRQFGGMFYSPAHKFFRREAEQAGTSIQDRAVQCRHEPTGLADVRGTMIAVPDLYSQGT